MLLSVAASQTKWTRPAMLFPVSPHAAAVKGASRKATKTAALLPPLSASLFHAQSASAAATAPPSPSCAASTLRSGLKAAAFPSARSAGRPLGFAPPRHWNPRWPVLTGGGAGALRASSSTTATTDAAAASSAALPALSGQEIRRRFIDFYVNLDHKHLPSSSLVPDDPTVFLTIAGMLQFKPIFLGQEPKKYDCVTTSQKCVRTNDIENVGVTARHHTFFEMLGNFSFGHYFKKEAIAMAWDLCTRVFPLPVERIWVSVYKDDDEAYVALSSPSLSPPLSLLLSLPLHNLSLSLTFDE